MSTRILTGITTTGVPHLGNYAGAIRPAIRESREPGTDAFFFLADYHALIKCDDASRVALSRLQLAATWLAAGLDPERVTFYRQSDIPEIPELCWILTCVTPKGLMNRAHAYKASVDQNVARGEDPDDGVTLGLFSYPVLMAADILIFNAHRVPVGRDQVQHLEMARDIAQRLNHLYGGGTPFFVLPEAQVDESVATLPGLDGRKMSKSYDNTIPLFEGGAKALKAAVMRIVTDSRQPGEPKDADQSHLFTLYRAFAAPEQAEAFRQALADGLGWGEAKEALLARIEDEIAPLRARYDELMAAPAQIDEIMRAGAEKARRAAAPLMERLRESVGLRAPAVAAAGAARPKRERAARFVSFRGEDGQFRFRLVAGNGDVLLTSEAYEDPRQAGQASQRLAAAGVDALLSQQDGQAVLSLEGRRLAVLPVAQLPALRDALAQLAASDT